MTTIGDRIKLERLRLNKSQDYFGRVGGVTKSAQINYEQGKRSPDGEYFSGIATIGADVLYIITGFRTPEAAQQDRATYFTPAKRASSEIEALPLSDEDADLLLVVARRLNKAA
jgi:transcriptional regulator with XRE-family HTH domain